MDVTLTVARLTGTVDYNAIMRNTTGYSQEQLIALLVDWLPDTWCKAYEEFTSGPTDIVEIRYENFHYLFDCYPTFAPHNKVDLDSDIESRLVVAYGRSRPKQAGRDDYRLRGWVGPTQRMFGREWDKGHYIANSIGGAVDRIEVNVFAQRRHLNRGWSEPGKRFRQMEMECTKKAGTFCFHRPLYADRSARPAYLEFGLLRANGELWVEQFDNR